MRIKMNMRPRVRNPWFWVGLVSVILNAMNVNPEMFTSWPLLWEAVIGLFSNPFQLGCVFLAVLGVLTDHTTKGIGDSPRALTYTKPE